ncbi:unnamed protein product [Closterium sp. Yama58-4]|nr:unnamed protein product [Closterium sp. Yama58-4]
MARLYLVYSHPGWYVLPSHSGPLLAAPLLTALARVSPFSPYAAFCSNFITRSLLSCKPLPSVFLSPLFPIPFFPLNQLRRMLLALRAVGANLPAAVLCQLLPAPYAVRPAGLSISGAPSNPPSSLPLLPPPLIFFSPTSSTLFRFLPCLSHLPHSLLPPKSAAAHAACSQGGGRQSTGSCAVPAAAGAIPAARLPPPLLLTTPRLRHHARVHPVHLGGASAGAARQSPGSSRRHGNASARAPSASAALLQRAQPALCAPGPRAPLLPALLPLARLAAGRRTGVQGGSGRVRPGSVAACAGNGGQAHAPVDQERADKAESGQGGWGASADAGAKEDGVGAELVGGGGGEAEEHLSSSGRTLGNLIISIVGAGVLGLPYAFMRSGWLVSLVSLAATAALTHRGMYLLLAARALQEDWEAEQLGLPQQQQGALPQKQIQMQEAKTGGDGSKEGSEQRGGGRETDSLLARESMEQPSQAAAAAAAAAAPLITLQKSPSAAEQACTSTTSTATMVTSRAGGKVRSYGDLGERVYGAVGRGAVDAMVLVSQGGFCAVFLVFMGHNVASVLWGSTLDSSLVIAAIAPFQVMLSWLPSLTQLAPFSIFASAVNFCAFSLVIFYGLTSFPGLDSLSAFTTLHDAPFAFGVATYALNGAGMTLSLESSMQNRAQFPAVLATGLSVISVLYAAVGTAGYFGFGNETKEIVTLNLPPGWQSLAVKLGVCAALFFTFPVMMTPVHEMAERYLSSSQEIYNSFLSPSVAPARRRLFVCFVRSLTVLFIVLLSVSVPHIGAFISLIGCSVCSALGFVVPALFHMKAARGKLEGSAVVGDWFLVGFGVVFGLWGTWNALQQMLV